MDLKNVAVFIAVASGGSLAGAARQLDLTPMTVSRRLAALESDLGVRLLHRTTRSVSLTPEGDEFLPYARTMQEAAEEAMGQLLSSPERVRGLLRVTAPAAFGRTKVMPLIPEILAKYPALRIDIQMSDNIVDIASSGIDVALRIAPLRDSDLVARAISDNPRILCASQAYLKRHAKPVELADLTEHECLRLSAMPRWPFAVDGETKLIRIDGRFICNSVEGVRTACVQGLGLALLTYWDICDELDDGRLIALELADGKPDALSVWALMPTRRYVPTRVRIFLETLEGSLRSARAKR